METEKKGYPEFVLHLRQRFGTWEKAANFLGCSVGKLKTLAKGTGQLTRENLETIFNAGYTFWDFLHGPRADFKPSLGHALFVEDERKSGEAVLEYLNRIGFLVTWVTTCEEAREMLNLPIEWKIAVVDHLLPDGNSLVVIRDGYLIRDRSAPPFIVITGEPSEDLSNSKILGAACALRKPFGYSELQSAIETCFEQSKPNLPNKKYKSKY